MELRKVERKTASGEWEEVQFADLKAGDEFKLYDPEDSEPRYEDGTQVYAAVTDPEPTKPDGNLTINVVLAELQHG